MPSRSGFVFRLSPKLRWLVPRLLLVGLGVLGMRTALAAGLRNIGAVLLFQAQMAQIWPGATYRERLPTPDGAALTAAGAWFRQADRWQPAAEAPLGHYALLYLAAAEPNLAVARLRQQLDAQPGDTLTRWQLAEELVRQRQWTEAAALYQGVLDDLAGQAQTEAAAQAQAFFRQKLARAQATQASQLIDQGRFAEALPWLDAASAELPTDVLVLADRLWVANALGQTEAAAQTRQALQQPRLDWTASAVEYCGPLAWLLTQSIWTEDLALGALDLLIWKDPACAASNPDLTQWLTQNVGRPRWTLRAAELQARRGACNAASALYRQIPAGEPEATEAAQRLMELGACEGSAPATAAEIDLDPALARDWLGVPVDNSPAGPNLAEPGPAWSTPDTVLGWTWTAMADAWVFAPAVYVGGVDASSGDLALRILGWWKAAPGTDEPARAGYYLPVAAGPYELRQIALSAAEDYLVSFRYRTQADMQPLAEVLFSDGPLLGGQLFLPPTQGGWRRFLGLIHHPDAGTLSPQLRNWGTGSVWFSDFEIRVVTVSSAWRPAADFVPYVIR